MDKSLFPHHSPSQPPPYFLAAVENPPVSLQTRLNQGAVFPQLFILLGFLFLFPLKSSVFPLPFSHSPFPFHVCLLLLSESPSHELGGATPNEGHGLRQAAAVLPRQAHPASLKESLSFSFS